MASWSSRRKAFFLSLFFLAALIVVGVPLFLYFYDAPTCADGKQNGGEEGIDCGGSCPTICTFQAVPPIVLWSRAFLVAPGVWSVVALVENPNFNAEAFDVPYVFKVRDERNILIYERKGRAYIPPKTTFPIFESGIITGAREPQKTFFEFAAVPDWVRTKLSPTEALRVGERSFSATTTIPRLSAVLENTGLSGIADISVVAVLFDADDNAVGASQTRVAFLAGESEQQIVFTWPAPFVQQIVRIEIVPFVVPAR